MSNPFAAKRRISHIHQQNIKAGRSTLGGKKRIFELRFELELTECDCIAASSFCRRRLARSLLHQPYLHIGRRRRRMHRWLPGSRVADAGAGGRHRHAGRGRRPRRGQAPEPERRRRHVDRRGHPAEAAHVGRDGRLRGHADRRERRERGERRRCRRQDGRRARRGQRRRPDTVEAGGYRRRRRRRRHDGRRRRRHYGRRWRHDRGGGGGGGGRGLGREEVGRRAGELLHDVAEVGLVDVVDRGLGRRVVGGDGGRLRQRRRRERRRRARRRRGRRPHGGSRGGCGSRRGGGGGRLLGDLVGGLVEGLERGGSRGGRGRRRRLRQVGLVHDHGGLAEVEEGAQWEIGIWGERGRPRMDG
ncbi:hypothetical protein GQ55_9G583400 [Panicum hallii var. hallii]|uniref:Uncharacterized protein n=1 Tax=Panicum hallii var. hallii TaxID=1504633 RepID=A0A2T7CGJ4_9POAL|nr:hypothetical protein GQ55_9G583400 [Panicum hallii var. hallii]